MTAITEAAVEAAARALYRREMDRAAKTSSVLTKAAGRPIADIVEPFEEHADAWMGDARAALEAAASHLAPAPDAVEAAVLAAATAEVTEQKFSTYKAKNGREVGIEDDNGEKCWIVPFDVMHALEAALACYQARSAAPQPTAQTFQQRVDTWLLACFGETIARDKVERNHRFIEEALELVQANGCTKSEAHQLVDYVYGREIGQLTQEVGGVMNTLAALCLANDVDLSAAAEAELARVSVPSTMATIRAKQAAKPKYSPLPEAAPGPTGSDAT